MSTFEGQNFKDLTTGKSVDAAYITDGTAKAWFYSSGTFSLTSSLNGSSITDNGTGNFDFAVTNSFSNTDDMGSASDVNNSSGNGAIIGLSARTSVSQFRYYVREASSGSLEDTSLSSGILMGDLA